MIKLVRILNLTNFFMAQAEKSIWNNDDLLNKALKEEWLENKENEMDSSEWLAWYHPDYKGWVFWKNKQELADERRQKSISSDANDNKTEKNNNKIVSIDDYLALPEWYEYWDPQKLKAEAKEQKREEFRRKMANRKAKSKPITLSKAKYDELYVKEQPVEKKKKRKKIEVSKQVREREVTKQNIKTASVETNLDKLSKSNLKSLNEKALLEFWLDSIDLQKRLFSLWNNLWTFWPKWDGVDGDLGQYSLDAIKLTQNIVETESSGLLDENFLRYIFPEKFNTGEWVWVHTLAYIKRQLAPEANRRDAKLEVLAQTKIEKQKLKLVVNKTQTRKITALEDEVKPGPRRVKIQAKKMANTLEAKNWPRYRSWASCWANVWEFLNEYWMAWLPSYGRDWYKWEWFLDNNENFVKVWLSSPNEALPWWILVYAKWYWRWARTKYGHVEIKTNDWYWYWWAEKKRAWWSVNSWFIWHVYYPKA